MEIVVIGTKINILGKEWIVLPELGKLVATNEHGVLFGVNDGGKSIKGSVDTNGNITSFEDTNGNDGDLAVVTSWKECSDEAPELLFT